MPTNLKNVVSYLYRVTHNESAESPDALLLGQFIVERDEAAFAALVRRHGPLVLATCRRLLDDANDVDDAFQATFFLLARKAASIVPREQVAAWLHGVAFRVASKARSGRARRLAREHTLNDQPAEVTVDDTLRHELWSVLDEEVARLPQRYRAPFVLCYLAGRTNEEAARELGRPSGTIFSRLARARELLRARLTRRGVTLSSAMLAAALATPPIDAAVRPELFEATVQGSLLVAAGQTAALGSHAANAIVLMQETTRTMFISQVKLAVVGILALLLTGGVAIVTKNTKPPAEVAGAEVADGEALKRENEKLKKEVEELRQKVAAIERKLTTDQEAAPVTYEGKPKSYWLGQFRDTSSRVRCGALYALGPIAQEDPSVVPTIIGALKDRNGSVREKAAEQLRKLDQKHFGKHAQLAISALVEATKDENPNVRGHAALALANLGPALGQDARNAVENLLNDKSEMGYRGEAGDPFNPGAESFGMLLPLQRVARYALERIDATRKADVKSDGK
jgi:RNA polymerase sigma factor (sigma-70 family)